MDVSKTVYYLAEVIAMQQEALGLKEERIRENERIFDKLRLDTLVKNEDICNTFLKCAKECFGHFLDTVSNNNGCTGFKDNKEDWTNDFIYELAQRISENNNEALKGAQTKD